LRAAPAARVLRPPEGMSFARGQVSRGARSLLRCLCVALLVRPGMGAAALLAAWVYARGRRSNRLALAGCGWLQPAVSHTLRDDS